MAAKPIHGIETNVNDVTSIRAPESVAPSLANSISTGSHEYIICGTLYLVGSSVLWAVKHKGGSRLSTRYQKKGIRIVNE